MEPLLAPGGDLVTPLFMLPLLWFESWLLVRAILLLTIRDLGDVTDEPLFVVVVVVLLSLALFWAAIPRATAAAAYLLATVPLGLSDTDDLSIDLPEPLFALDSRSKTAFALLNLDTRLAVLFRPPWPLALEPLDGDEAVEPLMLLLLPLIGEFFSFSVKVLILCIDDDDDVAVVVPAACVVLLLFSRSIDMACRLFAINWRALLLVVEWLVLLLISLIVDGALSFVVALGCLFGLADDAAADAPAE